MGVVFTGLAGEERGWAGGVGGGVEEGGDVGGGGGWGQVLAVGRRIIWGLFEV